MQKKTILILLLIASVVTAIGQVPQQFNYQGAVRNADGTPLANKNISLRLSILDGSDRGLVQYSEVRSVTTSALGLYTVSVGASGSTTTTGSFTSINWAAGLKFLKVEVDLNGGGNFVSAGATQLLSVPYALYAANSPNNNTGKSAYQIWLDAGNSGTEADFLNSLKLSSQPASGDLSGAYPGPSVEKLKGVPLSMLPPVAGQVLRYDGTSWTPFTLPGASSATATSLQPDIIELSNGQDAVLKPLGVGIKPGQAGSLIATDASMNVKWRSLADLSLVQGHIFTLQFSTMHDGTTIIPANNTSKAIFNIAGVEVGTPVFLTSERDEQEFQVSSVWVSAEGEITIRFANYQPRDVDLSGRKFKVLIVK